MMGHGGMQADTVLEKELRVLHLDMQATGSELRPWVSLEQRLPQSPSLKVTNFFQLGHTHFSKVTPPSSSNPFGGHYLPKHDRF